MIDKALTGRFFSVMAVLVFLPILALCAATFAWLGGKAEKALLGNARAVAVSVSTTVEDALTFGQPLAELRGANEYFQGILRENSDIQYIAILDTAQLPLFAQGIGKTVLAQGLAGLAPGASVILPLHVGGGITGSVVVAARPLDWAGVLTSRGLPLLTIPLFALALTAVAALLLGGAYLAVEKQFEQVDLVRAASPRMPKRRNRELRSGV